MKEKNFWFRLLNKSSGICGPWLFTTVARIIAAGFFLFSYCGRGRESRRFYAALYPERSKPYHLWCSFCQYQNFTTIHFDRFLTDRGHKITSTSEGFEKLEKVIGRQGGVLLMSHLGNWELAAHLLKERKKDLQMLLYMGIKEKEGAERIQKDELRRAGVKIIGVEHGGGSPFSAVEGIRFLREGGLVSMAGDIVWEKEQRRVSVPFLGHTVWLPEAPYVFSLLSGTPLFVFFSFRTGRNSYHFTLSDPIIIPPHSRNDRREVIRNGAIEYASLLEDALRAYPLQWYHFQRFLERKTKN